MRRDKRKRPSHGARKEDIKVTLALVTFSQVYVCQAELWQIKYSGNHQGIIYPECFFTVVVTVMQIVCTDLGICKCCIDSNGEKKANMMALHIADSMDIPSILDNLKLYVLKE